MEEISLTVDNNFVCIFWALWLVRKSHTWSNQSEQTCFFSSQSGVEATTKRDMAYACFGRLTLAASFPAPRAPVATFRALWNLLHVFPRLASVACCFDFWLAHYIICVDCDWPDAIFLDLVYDSHVNASLYAYERYVCFSFSPPVIVNYTG